MGLVAVTVCLCSVSLLLAFVLGGGVVFCKGDGVSESDQYVPHRDRNQEA